MRHFISYIILLVVVAGCSKSSEPDPVPPPPTPSALRNTTWSVNGEQGRASYVNTTTIPTIRFGFSTAIDRATVASGISLRENSGTIVPYTITWQPGDSVLLVQPTQPLKNITKHILSLTTQLKSAGGRNLDQSRSITIITRIDSTRKFPLISDDALLDKVQRQTFKYFWDYAHPVSGLARERTNWQDNIVTTGGSGFGILAIITGIHRGFITRAEGLARMRTIAGFLRNTAVRINGAYPHWMNGTTGAIVPFSQTDDGADLVETSYLIQGLLTARQYFSGAGEEELLRNDINNIWDGVRWNFFQNGQNVLYWHWSSTHQFAMNLPVKGWNEALITYILAASSNTHALPPAVYHNGWASNGNMRNGATYYGHVLPLGPDRGGPMFLSQYSFLGIDPNGLADTYADYSVQTRNHALINYEYSKANPQGFFGYSDSTWGLTASDIPGGYAASSPTNDKGVIAPTAALASFPYTPQESMKALRFYYYVLGDRIFREYGFVDAFSLHEAWFADSFLAIDQGPIIAMIENHRSGLLWDLFTSCPEIKNGMRTLGFTAPYL